MRWIWERLMEWGTVKFFVNKHRGNRYGFIIPNRSASSDIRDVLIIPIAYQLIDGAPFRGPPRMPEKNEALVYISEIGPRGRYAVRWAFQDEWLRLRGNAIMQPPLKR